MPDTDIQPISAEQPATEHAPQEAPTPELSPATPSPATEPEETKPASEPQPIEPVSTPSEPQPILSETDNRQPTTPTPTQQEPPAIPNQQPATDNQQPAPTPSSPIPTNNRQLTTDNSQPAPTAPPLQSAEAAQPQSEPARPHLRSLLAKALEKIQFRKRARLEKIMKLAEIKRRITNDDAQKLLRVSDATATRYLAELVQRERLTKRGVKAAARYELPGTK